MTNHRSFTLRRLHSLAGVLPLGVFLAEHLFMNSFAVKGPQAYDKIISVMQSLPYLVLVEMVIIILPLLYHGVYGLWVSWTAKGNGFTYTFYRNWMFYLQRVAGVLTFVFVVYHFYTLRFKGMLGQEISYQVMAAQLQNPLVFVFYLIGLLAAFYHFANGLFTFAITWGLTVGSNSQRVANIVSWIVFLIFTTFGLNALIAFR